MREIGRKKRSLLLATIGILATVVVAAQSGPARTAPAAAAPSNQEISATHEQFLKLLRTSPTLVAVLERDPSLLGDQAYVTRNNPTLEQFLVEHPEVAQNPDFYLFSQLESGSRERALARKVWPDMVPPQESDHRKMWDSMVPIVVVPAFFLAIVWISKLFVDGRRWNRVFKQQSEVHTRLIDKFGSSQELVAYMSSEAGRRFLEAAPIALSDNSGLPGASALSRVALQLQSGIVSSMLGVGLLLVRHASVETDVPMLVLGTLLLMVGLGFILSAGASWLLARKLGLAPAALPGREIETFRARDGE